MKRFSESNSSQNFSQLTNLIEIIFDLMKIEIEKIRTASLNASEIGYQGYRAKPNKKSFLLASKNLLNVMVLINNLFLLNTILSSSLAAQGEHYQGEANFFQDKYDLAEKSYVKANDLMKNAIRKFRNLATHHASQVRKFGIVLELYKEYYWIEAAEARAFEAEKKGNWQSALSLHRTELKLTQASIATVAPSHLRYLEMKQKLIGHAWYAKSRVYVCQAKIAAMKGNLKLTNRYEAAALQANKRSMVLNPQFRDMI